MNTEFLKLLADIDEGIVDVSTIDYITLSNLKSGDLIEGTGISNKAKKLLEPYKVTKAFIMAAGFGSRMKEVTKDIPKPLVKVNGVRLIETLIDAFLEADIRDITIVRGYKKECFDLLLEKYPFLKFVDNDDYDKGNNITSFIRVADDFKNCYLAEADFLVNNAKIIRKYQFDTNYLGFPMKETDDWCFDEVDNHIVNYRKGGKDTYQAIGISYWDEKTASQLVSLEKKEFFDKNNWDIFWEEIPLNIYKDKFKIQIRKINKDDIVEIDSLDELIALDHSYIKYKGE